MLDGPHGLCCNCSISAVLTGKQPWTIHEWMWLYSNKTSLCLIYEHERMKVLSPLGEYDPGPASSHFPKLPGESAMANEKDNSERNRAKREKSSSDIIVRAAGPSHA